MHNSQPFTKSPDFLRDIAQGKVEVIPGLVGYKGGKEVEFQGDRVEEIDAKYLSKINYALLGRGREEKDLLLHLRNIQINLFTYLEVNYD